MNTERIGIIGAGELGKALGHVLEKAGSQVLYYDRLDERTTTASIGEVVEACDMLLICVPSWANRDVAKEIAKHIKPQDPPLVISLSKGVEGGFVTMDQVLQDILPKGTPYGLMYGPMLATEMMAHMMSSGVLVLSQPDYGDLVRNLMARARVFLELTDDMHGTAVSGVLKNTYAMAFGVADGLKLGANARGRPEGLAGLGDLVSAGTSDDSFNYRVGRSIAEGIADEKVRSEGLSTLKELPHIITLSEYPLVNLLSTLIYHYGDPHEFQQLLEM